MASPTLPDTWAWDEHDMIVTESARRAEIIHNQIESIDAEALPWDPEEVEVE